MVRNGSHHIEFVYSVCPLCGSSKYLELSRHDRHALGLTTVLCECCGLVYTNPMPTPSSLITFYQAEYRRLYRNKSSISNDDIQNLGIERRTQYTVDFLATALDIKSVHSILDFGAGDGSLLCGLAKLSSANLVGVEPSKDYRAFAESRVSAELLESLTDISDGTAFDLITINHVLEHIADPKSLLERLGRLLSPEGQLYIDVPDVTMYDSIEDLHIAHLLHFSLLSLLSLLETSGFDCRVIERHRPPDHPFSIRLIATKSDRAAAPQVPTPDYVEHLKARFSKINSTEKLYRIKQRISRVVSFGKLKRLARRYL